MKCPADGQIGVERVWGNQLLLERVRGRGTVTCMAAFCMMGRRSWKASWMYVLLLEACKQNTTTPIYIQTLLALNCESFSYLFN